MTPPDAWNDASQAGLPGDAEILAARPPKNAVDPRIPHAFLVEPECNGDGTVEDVATIFLTNRECPFKCVYCDLWKNTTDARVPIGAIPGQIDHALARLPPARHIKLYNSGNFFDVQAIPAEDYPAIAERVRGFKTLIVENHPRLCGAACQDFQGLLGTETRLEVALGLETARPEVLARLNKRMTVDDFKRAAGFLRNSGIDVRVFMLLKPPFMSESEGMDSAMHSLEVAFAAGAGCCAVIPTRAGNGIMDQWESDGRFSPPQLSSLEQVLEAGLQLGAGRVFADLWDIEKLFRCPECGPERAARLRRMNLEQRILPSVVCSCGT